MIEKARASADGLMKVLNLLRPTLVTVAARICPDVAEERADDAIYRAWEHFDRFRGESDKELRAWLRVIVRNECFAYLKQQSRQPQLLDASQIARQAETPSRQMRREEERSQLISLLLTLTNEQREAVFFHYLEQWPIAEVALQMKQSDDDRSKDAVRKLIRRALEKLRSQTAPADWSRLLS